MTSTTSATSRYLDAFGVHVELITSATTQWNEHLMVGGSMISMLLPARNERHAPLLPSGQSRLNRGAHRREPAPWSSATPTALRPASLLE
jgi:hypothetical protein